MARFLTKKERSLLQSAHREEQYRRFADRIKVILALDAGYKVRDIAEMLLIDPETVRTYRKKFEAEGLEGLCSFSYQGRQSRLSDSQVETLSRELRSRIYLCTAEVLEFIERQFNIRYSTAGITSLLHRLGFSYKKPNLVPGKACRIAQENFLATLEILKAKKTPKNKLYYGEGTHPQHNSLPSYGWLPRGETTALKSNTGRRRVNISGVLDADSLEVIIQEDARLNAEASIEFFKLIERKNPESKKIYLILDNAGYYKGERIREYLRGSRIEILFLPPYSPNLNLIERLWKFFKKKVLYNKYYEKFEQFRGACLSFFSKRNLRRYRRELESLLTPNFDVVGA